LAATNGDYVDTICRGLTTLITLLTMKSITSNAGVHATMRKFATRSPSVIWLASLALVLAAAGLAFWVVRVRTDATVLTHGKSAYAADEWARAADLARKRLKSTPGDLEALRLLARATARLGNDSTANNLFARLGSGALQAEDLYLLGLGLSRRGQAAQAERTWVRALALDAQHAETLEQLARLYTARNRLAEAAVLAERLSRRPGWELRGELALGSLRAELSDPAGAAKVLRLALRRPDFSRISSEQASQYRKLLARVLLRTSQAQEARAMLKELLDRGSDEEAAWLLSRAELATGALEEASAALKAAGSYRKLHPL
jgi:tetratricopeptide (TPR) repeat protein